jgi:hypothetical protein
MLEEQTARAQGAPRQDADLREVEQALPQHDAQLSIGLAHQNLTVEGKIAPPTCKE